MYSRIQPEKLKLALSGQRKKAGFSQRQVEKILGLRHLRIYDYESGRLKLPVEHAVELANLYQCSLDELLGLIQCSEKADHSVRMLYPLMNMGLLQEKHYQKVQLIGYDPVIQAEMGVFEFQQQKPPIQLILASLDEKKRKPLVLELLKYMNSLIGVDNKISKGEAVFRDNLKQGLSFRLSDAEQRAVRKTLAQPYFGKSAPVIFRKNALKHLLMWMLLLCAHSDEYVNDKEAAYIDQVAVHIGLPINNLDYIKSKVRNFMEARER